MYEHGYQQHDQRPYQGQGGYGAGYDQSYAPPPQRYDAPPPQHPPRGGDQYYPPPNYPPPPGLDKYGMRIHQGQQGHGTRSLAPPPPSGMQQFGHGAPEGYSFQYSNCTGRRKALLIGINYFGQDGELRGCINDVKNVSAFLTEKHGYRRENMLILTDDQRDVRYHPTRENIINGMRWLVDGAQPNDSLFMHYSGHGGQTEDLDGDEEDGYDECLYPVDFQASGHIVDDEIHHLIVAPLQPGVRLTAIIDACHSGSMLDLPYQYSTKGVLKEPNLAKEAAEGLFSAFVSYGQGDIAGAAKGLFGIAKSAMGGGGYEKTKETKTSPADVIMWSGSKDSQTSADATINSQATGAMSWAFISALEADPQQSYVELLNSVRDLLESKYEQLPQLSASHPIDTDLMFIM
ncbi:probable Metacaspase-1 [Cephalotrichum gorgonifer]|uniref:Probable Metacaspase-1 n=1 Tax=Cephalotrichum gorgonifer TaxID=2041049 RepID=A0AAE8SWU2_9PEZI|nr:probable Metacaspase-1 [Cephalotrichum gorgonifer]